MKTRLACILPVLALLFVSSLSGRADQFSDIANNPNTYWVPAPTPLPGYYAGPPPPYYYYGPPPPRVYVRVPGFFFGFHIH